MPQLITINQVSIEHIAYKDQSVVTFAMIAEVHGISEDNVYKSFQRNKEKFTEGKHFYRIDYAEASLAGLSVHCNTQGVTLFTQKGYLLLTKPMRDQKSWQVQEQMIDEYFTLREIVQKPSALDAFPEMKAMAILLEQVAEQRLEIQTIKAEQEKHKDQIIETQQIALSALRGQQWVTIRQFVHIHDLQHQLPLADQKQYAMYLGKYCLEHGVPMYKALTADAQWPEERTYHAHAIAETLPTWLSRRTSQSFFVTEVTELA
jgi:phage regulator Rha-like protein